MSTLQARIIIGVVAGLVVVIFVTFAVTKASRGKDEIYPAKECLRHGGVQQVDSNSDYIWTVCKDGCYAQIPVDNPQWDNTCTGDKRFK